MSEPFTYEPPDADAYFQTLIKYLKFKKESQLADLLTGGKCAIRSSGDFSRKRWNAYYTTVDFYIPIERFVLVNDEVKRKLIDACAYIMPPEVGFDVMDVRFSPLIEEASFEKALGRDFDQIASTLSQEEVIKVLPDDIREKGREMATVYLHLYCVENCLRLFIEKVAKKKLGNNYFENLKVSNELKRKVMTRREQEQKNKWLSVRGDSELFYLDFKDLGAIIQNNWDLFASFFPNQIWILSKIDEFAECRNLVAHNSVIGDHERDVIRVNFNSILKQLVYALR